MRATVLALALVFAGAALADTPPPANAADHQAQMMADLATLLDLTDAQKPQVQSILQAQHTQMQAQHAQIKQLFEQAKASGTKPDFSQIKALHQQLEQETITKLTPVLTANQLAKFAVLQKMHHPHFHHGHGPGGAPANDAATPAS
jgi:Spy/CpxP family protein refolding chaperone